jgi:hypothetical protein
MCVATVSSVEARYLDIHDLPFAEKENFIGGDSEGDIALDSVAMLKHRRSQDGFPLHNRLR